MLYTAGSFDNKDIRQLYFGITNANVSKTTTETLAVTPAPHATFATAQNSLQADLQVALRTLVDAGIVDISQGIVWDDTNSVWQGWAIITHNPA